MGDDTTGVRDETHRGGFGDLGGEERGLIDRSFRERIIAVGFVEEGKNEAPQAPRKENIGAARLCSQKGGVNSLYFHGFMVTSQHGFGWFPERLE